jgi:prophage maintenance system killer protein
MKDRTGLYVMVVFILLQTCDISEQVKELKEQVHNLTPVQCTTDTDCEELEKLR